MGYWYLRPLKTDWELNESTTNRFDLPERGHLSGLLIELATYTETELKDYADPWPAQRTTIRVVGNGNVELINLRGRQLQAINYWNKGEMPEDVLQTMDTHYINQFLYLPFGRYLGDPEYGLILEKFASGVQFEETNTFSTTYYTDTYSKMTVHGMFRKDPEADMFNEGFLKKRQIINKDTASETQYGVKLPTVNKIREIHMFSEPDVTAGVVQTGIFTNLSKIWLGIKSKEEYILNNISASDWARFVHDLLGRRAEVGIFSSGHGGGGYMDTMIYERLLSLLSCADTVNANFAEAGGSIMERTANVYGYDADAGTESDHAFYGLFKGICYHGDVPLLGTDPKAGEEEFLDAEEQADVYVEFTEGASTGNIYIVLDELQKTYPA